MGRAKKNITIDGVTKTLDEWLEYVNLSATAYYLRIHSGYTPEQAIMVQKIENRGHRKYGLPQPKDTVVKKEKKKEYRFVRSSGGAGTWKWV